MRLQLMRWVGLAVALLFVGKPFAARAESTVQYKRLRYDEGDPGVKVDQDELEVTLELDNEDALNLYLVHDVVTGASPTGLPSTATVTGASAAGRGQGFANFDDERWGLTAGYALKLDRTTTLNASLHRSVEHDYRSTGLTLGATFELNKKNTTLAPSLVLYRDDVLPANGKPPASKTSAELTLTASQLLNPRNVLTLGLSYGVHRGYLSDPYKQTLVDGVAMDDARPDRRTRAALEIGWRTQPFDHHAFDLRYRRYQDDWGIHSDTLRVASLHDIGDAWLLEFFLRFYSQSAADFWGDAFKASAAEGPRSSDTRLARFTSSTLGATAIYKLNRSWSLDASLAQYAQAACGSPPPGTGGAAALGGLASGRLDDGGEDGEEEGGCNVLTGQGAYLRALVASFGLTYRF